MSKNTDLGSLVNYIKGQVTGRLNAPAYTSATAFTGTIAGYLGFDTSGNILTTAGVGFTGSGTTNYIPKFTGSTALGNSQIFDNGTNIGIGTNSPLSAFNTTVTILGTLIVQTSAAGASYNENIRLNRSANNGFASITLGSAFNSTTGTGVGQWTIYTDPLASGYNYIVEYNSSEKMRLTTAGGFNINTSTTGYTLNAIASTSTQFNAVYKGSGSLVQIMARFMENTTSNLGIAIGYASPTWGASSGVYATQEGALKLGVKDGIYYRTKIQMDNTNVYLDIPTSSAGLSSGAIWNDGGTVRIT